MDEGSGGGWFVVGGKAMAVEPVVVWLVVVPDPREESGQAFLAGDGVTSFWRSATHYADRAAAEKRAHSLRLEGCRACVEAFAAPGVNENASNC